jgi:hypothetical protein
MRTPRIALARQGPLALRAATLLVLCMPHTMQVQPRGAARSTAGRATRVLGCLRGGLAAQEKDTPAAEQRLLVVHGAVCGNHTPPAVAAVLRANGQVPNSTAASKRGRGRPPGSGTPVRKWTKESRLYGAWEGQFREMVAFKQQHGHCVVPMLRLEPFKKGQQDRRDGNNPTHPCRLVFVAVCSGVSSKTVSLRRLSMRGVAGTPLASDELQSLKLARWVAAQRVFYKRRRLNPRRIQRLERLGFAWHVSPGRKPSHESDGSWRTSRSPLREPIFDVPATWAQRYEQLLAFRNKHGHCNIPYKSEEASELGRWVTTQRTFKRHGLLQRQRKQLLDDIGFVWDIHRTSWREYFLLLMRFLMDHGHVSVPYKCMVQSEFGNIQTATSGKRRSSSPDTASNGSNGAGRPLARAIERSHSQNSSSIHMLCAVPGKGQGAAETQGALVVEGAHVSSSLPGPISSSLPGPLCPAHPAHGYVNLGRDGTSGGW